MIDLRWFKEAMISYRTHSPYVKQILNNWATQNRIIPQDWKRLITAILETGPQLQNVELKMHMFYMDVLITVGSLQMFCVGMQTYL